MFTLSLIYARASHIMYGIAPFSGFVWERIWKEKLIALFRLLIVLIELN